MSRVLGVVIFVVVAAGLADAQSDLPDLRPLKGENARNWVGQKIKVVAIVFKKDEAPWDANYIQYWVKDDYGTEIAVRSKDMGKLAVGKKHVIEAEVLSDKNTNEISLGEIKRINAEDTTSTLLLVLIIASAVVFVVLLVIAFNLMSRGKEVGGPSAGWEVPAGVLDKTRKVVDKQIAVDQPPEEAVAEGTLKVLPGRFEVVNGQQVKEFRLFCPKGADSKYLEYTIGRAAGPKLKHIQLQSDTVSKTQAKLTYANGQITFVNLAETNATKINGEALAVGGSRLLKQGDVLEMGELKLKFHA